MDDPRFDQLTRSLASGSSRRGVIRVLGGLLGITAGLSGGRRADAICNPDDPACECVGINCGQCGRCVGGECVARNEGGACTEVSPSECQQAVCSNRSCVLQNLSGTSCTSDGNPCTDDICQSGVCTHAQIRGQPCGGSCIGLNACCTNNTPGCPSGQDCVNRTCQQVVTDLGPAPGPALEPPPPLTCSKSKKLCAARQGSGHQDKCCPKSAKCAVAKSGAVSCRKKKKK